MLCNWPPHFTTNSCREPAARHPLSFAELIDVSDRFGATFSDASIRNPGVLGLTKIDRVPPQLMALTGGYLS
jgi:hypothetical protein